LEISKITSNAYLVSGESDLEAPAASWNCSAHGRSRSVVRSLDHGERLVVGRPVAKDGNRWKKKARPIALVFLYLFCPFSYLQKNMEMGWEVGRGVSRRYLWDPFLSWTIPYKSPIYTIQKRLIGIPYHLFCPSTSIGALYSLIIENMKLLSVSCSRDTHFYCGKAGPA